MIAELLRDHETCARWVLSVARSAVDAPTEDLMTQRLMAHEKAAWMLRSLLAEKDLLRSLKTFDGEVGTLRDEVNKGRRE